MTKYDIECPKCNDGFDLESGDYSVTNEWIEYTCEGCGLLFQYKIDITPTFDIECVKCESDGPDAFEGREWCKNCGSLMLSPLT